MILLAFKKKTRTSGRVGYKISAAAQRERTEEGIGKSHP